MTRFLKNKAASAALVLAVMFNVSVGTVLTIGEVAGPTAVVAIVVAVPLTQTACSKDQLLASARDVLDVVTNTQLIAALQIISPGAVAELARLVQPARDLITAIQNGNTTSALQIINTIFPVIETIASSVGLGPQAMAILALANLALHFIINHAQQSGNVPSMVMASPEGQAIVAYGEKPVWGCKKQYGLSKDQRCRELVH